MADRGDAKTSFCHSETPGLQGSSVTSGTTKAETGLAEEYLQWRQILTTDRDSKTSYSGDREEETKKTGKTDNGDRKT